MLDKPIAKLPKEREKRHKFIKLKMEKGAESQWLTPVILATWEAKIRRIMILSHPQQKNKRDPKKFVRPHLNGKK
jgi:hypothetical protein